VEAVEHPIPTEALVRPWRRATVVASLVAGVELVVLVFAGMALLARPFIDRATGGGAATAAKRTAAVAPGRAHPARRAHVVRPAKAREAARALAKEAAPAARPALAPARTPVAVLNGFGLRGAAAAAASRVRAHGYPVTSVANARKMGSPLSIVMYGPGLRPEGVRLARDLRIRVVGPLDGVRPGDLRGAKLVVVVGR